MITGTLTLVEEICCNCATHFAMDSDLNRRARETGRNFYCPNGHAQCYIETELRRLQDDKKSLQNRLSWAETEAKRAKNERKAARASLTRTKNRIANGVCPCCNRTFTNVARHMTSKHPDFKKAMS